MPKRAVVFDAYGTLFDVAAAARRAAAAPGRDRLAEREAELARIWRDKQIGYSWWRAVTGDYASFWTVTQDALDHALAATGLNGDPPLRDALLTLYWELSAYPEVPEVLAALRAAGRPTAILSNGAPDMLAAAVEAAGLTDALDHVISVEEVGTFKPDARVYALSERHLGVPPAETLFVSANGWDAAAATGYGFATLWVNRAGAPPERLPYTPQHEAGDLTAVPGLAAA
jgi:2-haloacid dehalogenase